MPSNTSPFFLFGATFVNNQHFTSNFDESDESLIHPVQFRFIGQSFNATVMNAHQINTLSEPKLLDRIQKFTLYSHF